MIVIIFLLAVLISFTLIIQRKCDNSKLTIESWNVAGGEKNGTHHVCGRFLQIIMGRKSALCCYQEVTLDQLKSVKGLTLNQLTNDVGLWTLHYNNRIVGVFAQNRSVWQNDEVTAPYGNLVIWNRSRFTYSGIIYPDVWGTALTGGKYALSRRYTPFVRLTDNCSGKQLAVLSFHGQAGQASLQKQKKMQIMNSIFNQCNNLIKAGYFPIFAGDFNTQPAEMTLKRDGMISYSQGIVTNRNGDFKGCLDYIFVPACLRSIGFERHDGFVYVAKKEVVNLNQKMQEQGKDHGLIYIAVQLISFSQLFSFFIQFFSSAPSGSISDVASSTSLSSSSTTSLSSSSTTSLSSSSSSFSSSLSLKKIYVVLQDIRVYDLKREKRIPKRQNVINWLNSHSGLAGNYTLTGRQLNNGNVVWDVDIHIPFTLSNLDTTDGWTWS